MFPEGGSKRCMSTKRSVIVNGEKMAEGGVTIDCGSVEGHGLDPSMSEGSHYLGTPRIEEAPWRKSGGKSWHGDIRSRQELLRKLFLSLQAPARPNNQLQLSSISRPPACFFPLLYPLLFVGFLV